VGEIQLKIEDLYDKYELPLLRYAKSLTSDNETAEDLIQDTFLRAMGNIQTLNELPEYQIKAWLFRVLKNCFIDKLRKNKFEIVSEFLDYEQQHSFEDDIESKILIHELLECLPEKSRDIVYKRYWLGMTSTEIADILAINPSTVRYHLHTAINSLKNNYYKFRRK
jgi:RNA polymerase sigma-70 factor, ECF subfamily